MTKEKQAISAPLYREVIRILGTADELEPSHDVRECVLDRFKEIGGVYTRWDKRDLRFMALSITRMEDIIEMRKDSENRRQALLTLAKVRRKLEICCEDK